MAPTIIYPRDPEHPGHVTRLEDRPLLGPLTRRETQIVAMLADGLSAAQIARDLWLSPETVKTHVRHARERLGARTTIETVATAIRRGIIE